MTDLFDQTSAPKILKATEELADGLGPCHPVALRSGSQWAGVIEAVRLSRSASSIVKYMEHLLCKQRWEGTDEALKVLGLNLDADGCYANWQLIGRDGAAGANYYVFETLRDLIADEKHWGLGLTEAELQAFIEPEEPSLWARVASALDHAQQPGRDDSGRFDRHSKNAKTDEVEQNKQARTRALGRAVENPKVGEMFDDQVLPKTVAAQFGTVSKDADHEQLKAECLERAYAVYTEAKQSMLDKPMAEQGKIISNTKKQVREALEPIKRWKAKPLGSADNPEWAHTAASLLVDSYTSEELGSLIAELSRLSDI